ncbi:unnamed protein product [Arabidopsis halleri]
MSATCLLHGTNRLRGEKRFGVSKSPLRDAVFGKLLWKNLVKNLEKGYSFLGSSTVRL